MKQEQKKNFFLTALYSPKHTDRLFNEVFSSRVCIIGDKKGLLYLAERINEYIKSGDCDYDNLSFEVGSELSEGKVALDIVCDDERVLKGQPS